MEGDASAEEADPCVDMSLATAGGSAMVRLLAMLLERAWPPGRALWGPWGLVVTIGDRINLVGGYWDSLTGDEGRGLVYEPAVLGRLVGIRDIIGATGTGLAAGRVLVLAIGVGAVKGMVLVLTSGGGFGGPFA
jgi:hypothetical protein